MMEIILAGVVSLAITLAAGKLLIPALIRLKAGQSIKEVGPTWHKGKQGTPTMGGLMFIIGIGIAILILGWRGMLEGNFTHLYDIGQGLAQVHEAHQQQDQRHIVGEGQRRNGAPQKQGAGIAHEHLGGIVVIAQEAQQAAHQSAGKNAQLAEALPHDAQHREEYGHRHRDTGGQTVDAVGDVDSVDGAHDDEGGKYQIDTPV